MADHRCSSDATGGSVCSLDGYLLTLFSLLLPICSWILLFLPVDLILSQLNLISLNYSAAAHLYWPFTSPNIGQRSLTSEKKTEIFKSWETENFRKLKISSHLTYDGFFSSLWASSGCDVVCKQLCWSMLNLQQLAYLMKLLIWVSSDGIY